MCVPSLVRKQRKRAVEESDLEGFKLLEPMSDLLGALRDESNPNRDLHFDHYVTLLLFYFFNPVLTSLRGFKPRRSFPRSARSWAYLERASAPCQLRSMCSIPSSWARSCQSWSSACLPTRATLGSRPSKRWSPLLTGRSSKRCRALPGHSGSTTALVPRRLTFNSKF